MFSRCELRELREAKTFSLWLIIKGGSITDEGEVFYIIELNK